MKEGMIFFYQSINEVKTLLPFDNAPVRSPFAGRGHLRVVSCCRCPRSCLLPARIKTTSTFPLVSRCVN